MKILRRIKAYYRLKKSKRFLEKHKCSSWREYNRHYDPDVVKYATLVSHYYHGYPYTCYFEYIPPGINDWQKWLGEIMTWADVQCSDKVRHDIHRVIREKGLIHNQYDDTMLWSDTEDFSMNDVGGRDVLFFAFKSEKDYTWFKLRWQ